MHQEFDAHSLPGVWRHVHRLANPLLGVQALMEDRLQDNAAAIGNVSVLPVELNVIGGAIPVPEAQCSSASRHRELLIERAVPVGLVVNEAAEAIWRVTNVSREGSAVRLHVRYHRRRILVLNNPWRETAGLEATVLDYAAVAGR
jgi:hypothetical protein